MRCWRCAASHNEPTLNSNALKPLSLHAAICGGLTTHARLAVICYGSAKIYTVQSEWIKGRYYVRCLLPLHRQGSTTIAQQHL